MIDDVDASLRLLLAGGDAELADVDVSFEAPTTDWASRRSAPTVNVYLYDLREDLRRRSAGRVDERDATGRVVGRRNAPRFFRLSYLLTAWTTRPEDEHHLLSALLRCCIRHDRLPEQARTGTLALAREATMLYLGRPAADDRSISEVWSALGGELKPSLDLMVSAPVDAQRLAPVAPAVTEPPHFTFVRPAGRGRALPAGSDRNPGATAVREPAVPRAGRVELPSTAPESGSAFHVDVEVAEIIQANGRAASNPGRRPRREVVNDDDH